MILAHYSGNPFTLDKDRKYSPDPKEPRFKPVGLWLSDCASGYGWKDWCEEQNWGISRLVHKTEFVCDTSKWVVLKDERDILSFTDEYSTEEYRYLRVIDWPEVMRQFSGIVITPYIWKCRLKVPWYYGWDCASACVWDLSTVRVRTEA